MQRVSRVEVLYFRNVVVCMQMNNFINQESVTRPVKVNKNEFNPNELKLPVYNGT